MTIVIHVEGYDDRAFVGGLLEREGWKPIKEAAERDLWRQATGIALRREPGLWYFVQQGRSLKLNPGEPGKGNKDHVWDRALEVPLDARQVASVACVDCDVPLSVEDPTSAERQRLADRSPEHAVLLVAWHWRRGVDRAGVPRQQTLERLALGVLSELEESKGYGAIVERFLEEAPRAPKLSEKHFAWATMAKWYGDHGCGDFYQALWREDAFARAMLATLDEHGILPVFREALAR